MKALILTLALFVGNNSSEDANSTNELNQLYAELISYYGWEPSNDIIADEAPQVVEVYDQFGNLLLKSANIDQDIKLIDADLVNVYRQAEFVLETGETRLYILNWQLFCQPSVFIKYTLHWFYYLNYLQCNYTKEIKNHSW